jgi:heme-degrading monooxygenase HmoA
VYARVSTYELEQGRASEATAAFTPAMDGMRDLDGFVDGLLLVESDGLRAMTITLWQSLDAMERSRIAATRVRTEAAQEVGATVTSSCEYEVGIQTSMADSRSAFG